MPSSFTNVLPNLSRAPQRHTQAFEFFREILSDAAALRDLDLR
jgi:hypothetical protein